MYRDYQDEPEDVFLILPEELACDFYALEMENYCDDCRFFERIVPPEGSLLEMGCGTGRVARYLASRHRPVTAIDFSLPMLRLATKHLHPWCTYLCMDMLAAAFRTQFDAILIPYNTLNLLVSEQKILTCLTGCRENLRAKGSLIVQLFIPAAEFLSSNRTTFQFQMFDRPSGGRIIKEILKKFLPESETVLLEERFRIRPMQPGLANEDYRAITSITAFNLNRWLSLFAAAGFSPVHVYGNHQGAQYDESVDSCCLLMLKKQ